MVHRNDIAKPTDIPPKPMDKYIKACDDKGIDITETKTIKVYKSEDDLKKQCITRKKRRSKSFLKSKRIKKFKRNSVKKIFKPRTRKRSTKKSNKSAPKQESKESAPKQESKKSAPKQESKKSTPTKEDELSKSIINDIEKSCTKPVNIPIRLTNVFFTVLVSPQPKKDIIKPLFLKDVDDYLKEPMVPEQYQKDIGNTVDGMRTVISKKRMGDDDRTKFIGELYDSIDVQVTPKDIKKAVLDFDKKIDVPLITEEDKFELYNTIKVEPGKLDALKELSDKLVKQRESEWKDIVDLEEQKLKQLKEYQQAELDQEMDKFREQLKESGIDRQNQLDKELIKTKQDVDMWKIQKDLDLLKQKNIMKNAQRDRAANIKSAKMQARADSIRSKRNFEMEQNRLKQEALLRRKELMSQRNLENKRNRLDKEERLNQTRMIKQQGLSQLEYQQLQNKKAREEANERNRLDKEERLNQTRMIKQQGLSQLEYQQLQNKKAREEANKNKQLLQSIKEDNIRLQKEKSQVTTKDLPEQKEWEEFKKILDEKDLNINTSVIPPPTGEKSQVTMDDFPELKDRLGSLNGGAKEYDVNKMSKNDLDNLSKKIQDARHKEYPKEDHEEANFNNIERQSFDFDNYSEPSFISASNMEEQQKWKHFRDQVEKFMDIEKRTVYSKGSADSDSAPVSPLAPMEVTPSNIKDLVNKFIQHEVQTRALRGESVPDTPKEINDEKKKWAEFKDNVVEFMNGEKQREKQLVGVLDSKWDNLTEKFEEFKKHKGTNESDIKQFLVQMKKDNENKWDNLSEKFKEFKKHKGTTESDIKQFLVQMKQDNENKWDNLSEKFKEFKKHKGTTESDIKQFLVQMKKDNENKWDNLSEKFKEFKKRTGNNENDIKQFLSEIKQNSKTKNNELRRFIESQTERFKNQISKEQDALSQRFEDFMSKSSKSKQMVFAPTASYQGNTLPPESRIVIKDTSNKNDFSKEMSKYMKMERDSREYEHKSIMKSQDEIKNTIKDAVRVVDKQKELLGDHTRALKDIKSWTKDMEENNKKRDKVIDKLINELVKVQQTRNSGEIQRMNSLNNTMSMAPIQPIQYYQQPPTQMYMPNPYMGNMYSRELADKLKSEENEKLKKEMSELKLRLDALIKENTEQVQRSPKSQIEKKTAQEEDEKRGLVGTLGRSVSDGGSDEIKKMIDQMVEANVKGSVYKEAPPKESASITTDKKQNTDISNGLEDLLRNLLEQSKKTNELLRKNNVGSNENKDMGNKHSSGQSTSQSPSQTTSQTTSQSPSTQTGTEERDERANYYNSQQKNDVYIPLFDLEVEERRATEAVKKSKEAFEKAQKMNKFTTDGTNLNVVRFNAMTVEIKLKQFQIMQLYKDVLNEAMEANAKLDNINIYIDGNISNYMEFPFVRTLFNEYKMLNTKDAAETYSYILRKVANQKNSLVTKLENLSNTDITIKDMTTTDGGVTSEKFDNFVKKQRELLLEIPDFNNKLFNVKVLIHNTKNIGEQRKTIISEIILYIGEKKGNTISNFEIDKQVERMLDIKQFEEATSPITILLNVMNRFIEMVENYKPSSNFGKRKKKYSYGKKQTRRKHNPKKHSYKKHKKQLKFGNLKKLASDENTTRRKLIGIIENSEKDIFKSAAKYYLNVLGTIGVEINKTIQDVIKKSKTTKNVADDEYKKSVADEAINEIKKEKAQSNILIEFIDKDTTDPEYIDVNKFKVDTVNNLLKSANVDYIYDNTKEAISDKGEYLNYLKIQNPQTLVNAMKALPTNSTDGMKAYQDVVDTEFTATTVKQKGFKGAAHSMSDLVAAEKQRLISDTKKKAGEVFEKYIAEIKVAKYSDIQTNLSEDKSKINKLSQEIQDETDPEKLQELSRQLNTAITEIIRKAEDLLKKHVKFTNKKDEASGAFNAYTSDIEKYNDIIKGSLSSDMSKINELNDKINGISSIENTTLSELVTELTKAIAAIKARADKLQEKYNKMKVYNQAIETLNTKTPEYSTETEYITFFNSHPILKIDNPIPDNIEDKYNTMIDTIKSRLTIKCEKKKKELIDALDDGIRRIDAISIPDQLLPGVNQDNVKEAKDALTQLKADLEQSKEDIDKLDCSEPESQTNVENKNIDDMVGKIGPAIEKLNEALNIPPVIKKAMEELEKVKYADDLKSFINQNKGTADIEKYMMGSIRGKITDIFGGLDELKGKGIPEVEKFLITYGGILDPNVSWDNIKVADFGQMQKYYETAVGSLATICTNIKGIIYDKDTFEPKWKAVTKFAEGNENIITNTRLSPATNMEIPSIMGKRIRDNYNKFYTDNDVVKNLQTDITDPIATVQKMVCTNLTDIDSLVKAYLADNIINRIEDDYENLYGLGKVIVKFRPPVNEDEDNVEILSDTNDNCVNINKLCPDLNSKYGKFTSVFYPTETNNKVYNTEKGAGSIKDTIELMKEIHFNTTFISYGLSGSGKTYTLMGEHWENGTGEQGVIQEIIETLAQTSNLIIEVKAIQLYAGSIYKAYRETPKSTYKYSDQEGIDKDGVKFYKSEITQTLIDNYNNYKPETATPDEKTKFSQPGIGAGAKLLESLNIGQTFDLLVMGRKDDKNILDILGGITNVDDFVKKSTPDIIKEQIIKLLANDVDMHKFFIASLPLIIKVNKQNYDDLLSDMLIAGANSIKKDDNYFKGDPDLTIRDNYVDKFNEYLKKVMRCRPTRSTLKNPNSSRSHLFIKINFKYDNDSFDIYVSDLGGMESPETYTDLASLEGYYIVHSLQILKYVVKEYNKLQTPEFNKVINNDDVKKSIKSKQYKKNQESDGTYEQLNWAGTGKSSGYKVFKDNTNATVNEIVPASTGLNIMSTGMYSILKTILNWDAFKSTKIDVKFTKLITFINLRSTIYNKSVTGHESLNTELCDATQNTLEFAQVLYSTSGCSFGRRIRRNSFAKTRKPRTSPKEGRRSTIKTARRNSKKRTKITKERRTKGRSTPKGAAVPKGRSTPKGSRKKSQKRIKPTGAVPRRRAMGRSTPKGKAVTLRRRSGLQKKRDKERLKKERSTRKNALRLATLVVGAQVPVQKVITPGQIRSIVKNKK